MIPGAVVFSIVGLFLLSVIVLLGVLIVISVLSKGRGVFWRLAAGGVAILALLVISVVATFSVQRQAGVSHATSSYRNDRALVEQAVAQNGQGSVPAEAFQDVTGLVVNPQPQSHQNTGITIAGTPWSNAVEKFQDFEADVYPSLESAAKALGRRVGQRLREFSDAESGDAVPVYVWQDAGGYFTADGGPIITRDILVAVANGLRQKLDEPAQVSVGGRSTSDIVRVRVACHKLAFEHHNRWRRQTESRSGGIVLRVETPGGPFSVSARFVDAPWVVDRTAFARRYTNGDWLVAFSDGTHTTNQEARQDALAAATEALLPLAQARISQLSDSDQRRYAQQVSRDPDWLLNRVADELVSRNLVTDRFTQSFDRPYGTIWREAALIDASPKQVEAIARSLVRGIDAQVTHQRTTWFSLFGLGGLIFGTYLFLNMATKGYYTWALRLAAVAGLVAAGFVVTHLF